MHVGQIARRTRSVTARDIELFTEITGDHNPLQCDRALAAASRFNGIIVQGGVTSGLLNALVAEDLPGPGSVFLHVDWNFRAAVRPGDEITAEAEVLEMREDKPIYTCAPPLRNPIHAAPTPQPPVKGDAAQANDVSRDTGPEVLVRGRPPDTLSSRTRAMSIAL